jgi:methionine--tRNA ligase beta chain
MRLCQNPKRHSEFWDCISHKKMLRTSLRVLLGVSAASAYGVRPLRRAMPLQQLRSPQPLAFRSRIGPFAMMCNEAPPAPAPPAPAPATEDSQPFELLDVRVGCIVEAWEHPDSDKLWCERIDVGEEEPREIASGLRAYYPAADDLTGRKVIVVCNLKAAKLAGFSSNGMVLCASSEDRSTVAFVEPPEAAEPGDRVLMEGAEAVAPATGNQMKKKKWMEKAAEELKAVDTIATYQGKALVVAGAACTSPSVSSGTIN